MNRRTLIVVFGLALRAGAFLAVILPHRRPEPPKAVTNAKTPAPPPPLSEAPKAEAPPPEPTPRSARRSPAPKPRPAPSPVTAPTPVEAAPEVGTLSHRERRCWRAGLHRPRVHWRNAGHRVERHAGRASPERVGAGLRRRRRHDRGGAGSSRHHDQALFVFHRDVEKARERLKKGDPPARDSRAVF